MNFWKAKLKRMVPGRLLNETLLRFPFLYARPFVNYETNLVPQHGIEDLLSQVTLASRLEGDIVECGASRCGSTVLMANRLRELGRVRPIHVFDSFEGFDLNELRNEQKTGETHAGVPEDAFSSTSLDYAKRKLARFGHADSVHFTKGYFEKTLQAYQGQAAMAFIDCDLKQSLVFCAETLWSRVVPGGRMVFDDYTSEHYRGAKAGVDEFVAAHAGEIADHGLLNRLYFVVKR